MSVLVKGMEMPTSCDECYIREKDTCPLTKTNVTGWGRPLNCPLVELPPHGRLIDGDKLAEEQKENVGAYHTNLITLEDLAECLLKQSISEDGAPTIIEADPEEEKIK